MWDMFKGNGKYSYERHPWCFSGVFFINFKHIFSYVLLVLLSLTLSMYLFPWKIYPSKKYFKYFLYKSILCNKCFLWKSFFTSHSFWNMLILWKLWFLSKRDRVLTILLHLEGVCFCTDSLPLIFYKKDGLEFWHFSSRSICVEDFFKIRFQAVGLFRTPSGNRLCTIKNVTNIPGTVSRSSLY